MLGNKVAITAYVVNHKGVTTRDQRKRGKDPRDQGTTYALP